MTYRVHHALEISWALTYFLLHLDPIEKAAAFGVMQNDAPTRGGALVTGFVGLALADIVQPWVTFGPLSH